MVRQSITIDVMDYMVWVVELVAHEFFNGDKSYTYNVLCEQGIWEFYIENYDITHTLSAKNIIEEVRDILTAKDVI